MAESPEETQKQPTPAEAMQIAQAALKAAEEARSAAEARPAIEKAAEEEAEAQGHKLSQEEVDLIASTVIAQIEARGGFEPAPPPAAPEAPEAPEGGEGVPGPGGGEPGPGGAPELEEAPRKLSIAERFQGKSGS